MGVDIPALVLLTEAKGMPLEQLIQMIEAAILTSYSETPEANRYARVQLDRETGDIAIYVPTFNELGERVSEDVLEVEGFDRMATSTARQTIKMQMRATNDAEIVGEFTASVGDVISGIIQQGRDPKMIHVNLGRIEGKIPPQDQVPGEVYTHGERIKCFVVEVKQGLKGPEIMLSRSHPGLVKQLFALEVPEVKDGIVEIMGVSREAGHRTKIAVKSHRAGVSPKGSLIGPLGARSRAVMDELNGEKIDIVDYDEDPAQTLNRIRSLSQQEIVAVLLGLDLIGKDLPEDREDLKGDIEDLRTKLGSEIARIVDASPAQDSQINSLISQAFARKRRLAITYYSPTDDQVSIREITPLQLTTSENRDFLIAFCESAGGQRTFRVDRIQSATLLESPASEIPTSSANDIRTVATVKISENIRRCRESLGAFVSGDGPTVQVSTYSYGWLSRTVMSAAGAMEVTSSAKIREGIAILAGKALDLYR